jgi:hypothetical protein
MIGQSELSPAEICAASGLLPKKMIDELAVEFGSRAKRSGAGSKPFS